MRKSISQWDLSRVYSEPESLQNSASGVVEAWDDESIAGLSPSRISQMTCDELAEVIQAAQMPFLNANVGHLAFRDRPTLERLASLAQRCCQGRVALIRQAAIVQSGIQPAREVQHARAHT